VKPDDTGLIEDLLKRRAQVQVTGDAAGGPLCGDPEILASYAENSLDQEGREGFQIHLAACSACRDAVAALVRMAPREVLADTARPERQASWWKPWIWAPAMAGLLIAGSVVLMNRQLLVQEPGPMAKVYVPSGQHSSGAPAAAPPAEPARIAPLHKEALTTNSRAPAEAGKKADENMLALDAKAADAVEVAGGGGSKVVAPPRDEVADARPVLRKQETQQAAAGVGGTVPLSPQSQNPPPTQSPQQRVQQSPALIASQSLPSQNFAPAPPPAPSANSQQNEPLNTVKVAPQNTQAQVNNTDSTMEKARMMRIAPPAAKAPSATPAAAPGAAGGATAASIAPKAVQKAVVVAAKGRIEKGALFLSTDGGATWRKIATPEPVASFQITDSLNFEIRTQSLTVFHTKDGGKTWQAEKSQQP